MIWDSGSSIKQYFLLPSSYMFIFVHFFYDLDCIDMQDVCKYLAQIKIDT